VIERPTPAARPSRSTSNLITLYCPIGVDELIAIVVSQWRGFPPRGAERPIFHPVTTEGYGRYLGANWAGRHGEGDCYLVRFAVGAEAVRALERRSLGGPEREELWVAGESFAAFNAAIVGGIHLIAEWSED